MSCIYSLGFYRYLFFTVLYLLPLYVFLLIYYIFRNFVNLFYILSSCSSFYFDKDITHAVRLQGNIASLELWIIFPITFLFLLVWCKQKSDRKVKVILLFLICFLKTNILQISLITSELVPDQIFLRQSSWISVMIFNFRLLEWTAIFILFLILLSGDISLNPGPHHQHKLEC